MFRELEYQTKVFATLDRYLDALVNRKANAAIVAKIGAEEENADVPVPDFTADAWSIMREESRLPPSRSGIPFSPRTDGVGRPVPNVTLKVPTGGGKTWLAVKSASMILNKYLAQDRGFILWVVPSEAIYTQTLRHFKDRQHPYRQAFERASAGRVKILTKTDRLHAVDVETHLCVMVLMLQSANRQTKETLKMFRDRGDVHGFVPGDGEEAAHRKMVEHAPNLDVYEWFRPQVKSSLGNALRIIRPVVVLDEGHKAISDLARTTMYGFNPSFVLELTATPKDTMARGGRNPIAANYANLLVEITGKELDREGMIKMPLMLDPFEVTDWRTVLNAAVSKINALQEEATTFQAEGGGYIRPILLVQVERTGKDARDGSHIHAADAREHLLQIGFNEAEIALKTAEQNDLNTPETRDLLSPYNQVRVIITKEALQEGWDCPFAYVLCSLAARSNANAMTQLVGRILRQPYAEKTEVEALDQCYVFTHLATTNAVIGKIKSGLEQDGLSDLVVEVTTDGSSSTAISPRKIRRQQQFRSAQIHLPQVLINRDGIMMPLDFETDILSHIDWTLFDPSEVVRAAWYGNVSQERQLTAITLTGDDGNHIGHHAESSLAEFAVFDPVHVVRQINDIILNPFVAWPLLDNLINMLKEAEYDDLLLGFRSAWLVESLRKELLKEQEKQAEELFKQAVHDGHIQFRLRADGKNWQMPNAIVTNQADQAYQIVNHAGNLTQKNLFERVYQMELNRSEREVAVYLDGQEAVGWWFRNVARRDYGLRGWKKNVIYPDLIFSIKEDGKTMQLVALETKGTFLDGTEDTEYKRKVMQLLTEHFCLDGTQPVGKMQLECDGITVICDLILFDDWQTELPDKYFS